MATRLEIETILKDEHALNTLIKYAFDVVDTDQAGFLSTDKLKNIMTSVAEDINCDPPTLQDMKEVMDEVDVDNDGEVSISDFKVLIISVLHHLMNSDIN